jgi:4-aminobutyrate aminotransferase-like enzyme
MAKAWTGKRGALAMDFAYHGITDAIDAFSPSSAPDTWKVDWIRLLPPPDDYRGPHLRGADDLGAKYAGMADPLIAELERKGYGLAACMIDGAFMTNGMLEVPEGYVRRICEKTRKAGGLYIADEVQSGFGRMGTAMWGYQHHGIVPDFVTIGKPAGNGLPIGVVVTRPEILEYFTRQAPFFSTFGGNNVSCAAGIAVLDVIRDEKLIDNARDTGRYLREGLRALMNKHQLIGDVRGNGLSIGVELVRDRSTKEPADRELKPLLNRLRDEGVLAGNEGKLGNIVKIRPPLVFSKANADFAVAALDNALCRF